ncbi:MAG: oligopeptide/dipeptide ABC transporter ATP-binding protein [Steroidobacteraceae bacterium]
MSALLQALDLEVSFPLGQGWTRRSVLRALRGVSLSLGRGEAVGIVGESGCGKSTLARVLLGLIKPDSGQVLLEGRAVAHHDRDALLELRRRVQMVFQDPRGSLNPRLTILESIAEPLRCLRPEFSASERRMLIMHTLEQVGLDRGLASRYPHELSGGQCQRAGIARAIVAKPDCLVCDEPVSALDLSIQGQIVNLLADLRREIGVGVLFISHNLSVVRHLCDRVLVMHLGQVVEEGTVVQVFTAPRHPYTQLLLSSELVAEPGRPLPALPDGEPASPLSPPAGCSFVGRCPVVMEACRHEPPPVTRDPDGHATRCYRWTDSTSSIHSPAIPLSTDARRPR